VANAMAHGVPGRPVRVISRLEAESLSIAVHNEGTPIPEPLLARIFEPMTRGGAGGDGRHSVGLGLYIVRQIARAHAGDVSVASTPGEGTTFTLTMPRQPPG
jgi:sigma-B regulation protein RsbU (phosphoserine phosphatase)